MALVRFARWRMVDEVSVQHQFVLLKPSLAAVSGLIFHRREELMHLRSHGLLRYSVEEGAAAAARDRRVGIFAGADLRATSS